MKKFLVKFLIILSLLAIADLLVDSVGQYLYSHAKGGQVGKFHYITSSCSESVLIMGASRAQRHYNPQIIGDSLMMSCYNCGWDSYGVITFYSLYLMLCERYTPDYIIYDVSPGADYMNATEDDTRYVDKIRPFYNHRSVRPVFSHFKGWESLKVKSAMYRYNGNMLGAIFDNIKTRDNGIQGFTPIVTNNRDYTLKDVYYNNIDTIKLGILKDFITDCKSRGTKLIFVISPYYERSQTTLEPIREICKENDVLLLDFTDDLKYKRNEEYFYDVAHLNSVGADIFSMDVARRVNNIIHTK